MSAATGTKTLYRIAPAKDANNAKDQQRRDSRMFRETANNAKDEAANNAQPGHVSHVSQEREQCESRTTPNVSHVSHVSRAKSDADLSQGSDDRDVEVF